MDYIFILFSIIMVNLLLSGDNALVIALASRKLPTEQQKKAILWGGAGAVGLRILLTMLAILVLRIPFLQAAGGLFLAWISIQLVRQENHQDMEQIEAKTNLWEAVKTIIMADLVMSLDNVIAIAGIAKGNILLLFIGLALSVPAIIWGSKLMMVLMDKWPVAILAGAAFLGWTGGEMVVADPWLREILSSYHQFFLAIPTLFSLTVIFIHFLTARKKKNRLKD
ncbi:integral membrane protein terc [Lucifera butyrica]|uniref:Integral membrane protein terc n=1 Tax=Lucifera butyrica TaxID=1351585 RepID=A0A498RCB9_9FIRM|nr:TerC family protein [Lucifera butyrica]VBB06798.1 integral membrane protein terc [Lucifera butyrica]